MATVFALKQGHWGLVAVYLWSFEDVGEQPFAERCHQPGQLTGPAAHHIAIDLHPLAAQDHRLSMPSLMIEDRKSVVQGKRVSVRVALRGRHQLNKQNYRRILATNQ